MSQGLKETVVALKSEQQLLQQLIYRNHNQHSSSQLFSYLKNAARVLKLITPERLHAAGTRCETALRSSGQAKLTPPDISEIVDTHILLFAVVNMLTEAMVFTLKANDLVRILLGKKLFLPLYTMLLAVSARLFSCLSELHKHFYVQCNALTSQLKHIALLNPRMSKQIAVHLANHEASYSDQVLEILKRMIPVSTSTSTSTTVPAQSHTTVSKPERTIKDSRNASTNSLASQFSKGDNDPTFSTVETREDTKGTDGHEDSDLEDAGLLIGAASSTSGKASGTLTPSASRSDLAAETLHKTPQLKSSTPATSKPEAHIASSNTTDFDSLFAPLSTETPVAKKQKTEALVKSKSTNDLVSVKYSSSLTKSDKESKKMKDKNGSSSSGSTKEKKSKDKSGADKSGNKRKAERTDDIDDIFGF